MYFCSMQAISQKLELHDTISVTLRREDLLFPAISGNKWRKLKYNIQHILQEGYEGVLTFGGAHSNHIAATAYAAKKFGFKAELQRKKLIMSIFPSSRMIPKKKFLN